ncbi:hypothetical protein [Jatrophihabitans endophyticus]|uniref:hypothetical protein n=1 Tax=Jatrophihabitans endophyticus TaxID=1206085 RepID=UPI0019F7D8F9|nr:hypothetical protein [Jatrophihabitans endophyticus]MBE7189774.1 hypothetical protein [Jatrophihabitans endophyticus]
MSAPGPDSAAELNAVLTTLTQWVQRAMPAPPSGHPGPECEWCPLCQLASVLRGEHPELTDRLAEAGAAVAGAARALLESASLLDPTPPPPPEAPPRRRPRPRPRLDPDDPAGR